MVDQFTRWVEAMLVKREDAKIKWLNIELGNSWDCGIRNRIHGTTWECEPKSFPAILDRYRKTKDSKRDQ